MNQRPPVSVAIARFEDIVARGLRALVDEDVSLQLVAADVPHEQLAATLEDHRPQVAIVNFGSLLTAGEVRDLHHGFPGTRLVVLANHRPGPRAARCWPSARPRAWPRAPKLGVRTRRELRSRL